MIKIILDKPYYTINDIINILKDNNISSSRQGMSSHITSENRDVKFIKDKAGILQIPAFDTRIILIFFFSKYHLNCEIIIEV